jgi:hypothetical protein
MIVYNVERRWFTEKVAAEKYRVLSGLKPSATLKLDIKDRKDLASLLNALCVSPVQGFKGAGASTPEVNELIDRAYVDPDKDIPDFIPDFLLKDYGLKR